MQRWSFSTETFFTVAPVSFANGGISPNTPQTVVRNATLSFNGTANAGYQIESVTGCGGLWTGTNPYTTGPITADCTVSASFIPIPHPLALTISGNGIVHSSPGPDMACTDACEQNYNDGTVVFLTADPAPGYTFANWFGACAGVGTCQLTMAAAASVTATFALDTEPPQLLVSTLADGSYTAEVNLNISGQVSDNLQLASLSLNAQPLAFGAGEFSSLLSLQEGANTITLVATDTAGNSTSDSRTIILDSTLPQLTINTPADNSQTANPLLTVSGSVSETASVRIGINGGTAEVVSLDGNAFAHTLLLSEGLNTIDLSATDLAGHTVSAKRTVLVDFTAPSLAITEPAADSTASTATLTVSGTIADNLTPVTLSATLNGIGITPIASETNFSFVLTMTTAGAYQLVVTAVDQLGNSVSVLRNLLYEPMYALNVASAGNGSGSIAGGGTYPYGSSITLQPTAGSGSYFAGWLEPACQIQPIVISSDLLCTAIFTLQQYTLTVAANGNGTVGGSGLFDYNSTVTPIATANTGSSFTGWTPAFCGSSFAMTADTTCTAHFLLNHYTVTALASGSGSVTGGGSYPYGGSVTLQPSAAAHNHFTVWLEPACQSQPITVSGDLTCTALFALDRHTVTVASDGSGSGTVGGGGIFDYGSLVAPTAVPALGSLFGGWIPMECGSTFVLTDDIACIATFALDTEPPQLLVSTLADGSYTAEVNLNISGQVSDNLQLASLSLNAQPLVFGAGEFSTLLSLQEGANTITLVATDTAGNITSDSRTIILDSTLPQLTINTPADNSKTNNGATLVTGSISDAHIRDISITVNGEAPLLALFTGSDFSLEVNLRAGMNTVDITATDLAGNTSSVKRTVAYIDQAPALSITVPIQDATVLERVLILRGTASQNLATVIVEITLDAETFTPPVVDGAFEQPLAFTQEKTYRITVTATDEAGNVTSAVRHIQYTPSRLGDLDQDGTVAIDDVLRLMRIVLGDIVATPLEQQYGDVAPLINGKPTPDGKLDLGDVVILLRKMVGLVTW